ncbi:hypothetical protein X474_16635 [Dethiosulfatarculus sandiegensis]|uniref:Uncharacterized protein n=1 Tax=Dethiosulfatarculus sandiegensis TaxID=1429043 RepID=A0A0D2GDA3_9BACT|nr:hypothetical protein X474_16635 [Dethiosulfatarculus sandiegensis]
MFLPFYLARLKKTNLENRCDGFNPWKIRRKSDF